MPKYPEWVQSKAHYERERTRALEIMKSYTFNVDMTKIKGDGGGTQYTWLEAWEVGCIPIIHKEWVQGIKNPDMKPDYNCLAVENEQQLAYLLQEPPSIDVRHTLIKNGLKQLKLHAPEVIGKQYLQFLNKGTQR